MRKLLVFTCVFMLTGCMTLGSPKADHNGEVNQVAPVFNIPLKDIIKDKAINAAAARAGDASAAKASMAISTVIETKMKTVQDNVNGLITAKVDEIGKLIDIKSSIETKLDIRNRMEATMTAVAKLSLSIQNEQTLNASFRNEMKVQLKAFSDNMIQAQTSIDGQAGVGNKIDKVMETVQTELKAGRDVYNNSMSKETVKIMLAEKESNQRIVLGIMAVIQVIALTAMGYVYKSQRQRNNNNTKMLMFAMSQLEPEHADTIRLGIDS